MAPETFQNKVDRMMQKAIEDLMDDDAEILDDRHFLEWLRTKCENLVREEEQSV